MHWTRQKSFLVAASVVIASLAQNVFAETSNRYQVVAPTCLIKHAGLSFRTLSTTPNLSLVETSQLGIEKLVAAKKQAHCGGFKDVTFAWQTYTSKHRTDTHAADNFLNHYAKPQTALLTKKQATYKIQYEAQVNQLTQQLNPQAMWASLTTLTSFKDRYAGSDNGVAAAKWLKEQVETMAKNNHRDDVTAYFVKTGSRYQQPSLVVKVGSGTGPGIVVGGHMDTLSSSYEVKPGADDDGTGTVTVLELARTVLSSDMRFKKPIYFIWYAAEEMGLVGSQYVVSDFVSKKIPVDAVVQFDMTGYAYQNETTMWLMTDHVNKNLTKFLGTLIDHYVHRPVKLSACGYGCSDHASWDDEGFVASMPFETEMNNDNPDIHTSGDVMDNLSLEHMTDYLKLGAAYVVELAEPVA